MQTVIEALVARVPQWEGLPTVVRQLLGSPRHQTYLVAVDGHEYVVRWPSEHSAMLGINPTNEAEASRRAAALGIGPDIVGELPETHTLVSELVAGRPVEGEHIAEHLDVVIDMLRLFHGSGPLNATYPVHRAVEWHARDSGAHGVIAPAAYERLHQLSRRIEAAFAKEPLPAVPCHNDLLPANLLFHEDRAWLIDFECAGMNDVFFDLANLSVNCRFDAATDEQMIFAYFGELTTAALGRLQLMKVMSHFRDGMWAVVQRAIGILPADSTAPEQYLRSCERLAAQPEFDQWLIDAAHPVRDQRS